MLFNFPKLHYLFIICYISINFFIAIDRTVFIHKIKSCSLGLLFSSFCLYLLKQCRPKVNKISSYAFYKKNRKQIKSKSSNILPRHYLMVCWLQLYLFLEKEDLWAPVSAFPLFCFGSKRKNFICYKYLVKFAISYIL